MVNVRIDERELYNMLIERLNFWNIDEDYNRLADEIREAVYDGWLEDVELDIKAIIDNLVNNNYHLIPDYK